MSSVSRRFRVIDGEVSEVTAAPPARTVNALPGYSEKRPGKSIGMSCHPSQIPERNALLKAHGITGAHYDPSKRDNCVITARGGRRELMKILDLHDEDGGYGDG